MGDKCCKGEKGGGELVGKPFVGPCEMRETEI